MDILSETNLAHRRILHMEKKPQENKGKEKTAMTTILVALTQTDIASSSFSSFTIGCMTFPA